MGTTCPSCGTSLGALAAGKPLPAQCPACRCEIPSSPRGAAFPSLHARDPGFRSRHSVEAGEVFSRSFRVWIANLFPFVAMVVIVYSPLILYTIFHVAQPLEGISRNDASRYNTAKLSLGALLGTLATASVAAGVFQYLRETPLPLGTLLSAGARRIFPALWTSIVATVLAYLPMLPGGAMVAWTAFRLEEATREGNRYAGGVGIMFLGMGLMVVGMVFTIMITSATFVAIPASVVEKCNGWPAIRRSLALTKGNRSKIFVILLVLGILGFVAGLIIQWTGDYRTQVGLNLAVTLLSASFGSVFSGVVYYNLRAIKEGIGIEELAKAFD